MAVLGDLALGDRDRGVYRPAGGGYPGVCADAGGCAGQPDGGGFDHRRTVVYRWLVAGV